jgi:hypothetical protein
VTEARIYCILVGKVEVTKLHNFVDQAFKKQKEARANNYDDNNNNNNQS